MSRKLYLRSLENKAKSEEELKRYQDLIKENKIEGVEVKLVPLSYIIVPQVGGKVKDWCDIVKDVKLGE